MPVAAATAVQVLIAVVLWALVLTPAIVTALKGHTVLFIAGCLLIGIVWFIAAPRLATPNSYWARRFYGPEKLGRARARCPDTDPADHNSAGVALAIAAGSFGLLLLAGFICRRQLAARMSA